MMKNCSKKIWLQALAILNIENPNSLQELKNIYRLLCRRHHPDRGGNTETMQQINWAYEYILKNMDKQENSEKAKINNLTEEGQKIFEELLLIDNIEILIVGSWLWVSGNTKPHKDKLKELGLYWHTKKQMWAYAGSKTSSKGNMELDKIIDVYGSSRHQKKANLKISIH
jgi:hypothetical protein